MAVQLIEKPERTGSSSQTDGKGQWKYVARVTGANPETQLLAAIVADTGYFWYNLALKNVAFEELAVGLYSATVDFSFEVPDSAAQSPTGSPGPNDGPGGTAPSGTPSGITSDADQVGIDLSFEIGGKPPKLTTSRGVQATEKAGGGDAPDFGAIINYNATTGEVDGVEIPDPDSTMTVFRVFDYITISDIKLWIGAMWHTNRNEWFGMRAGNLALCGVSVPEADRDGRRKVVFRIGLRTEETYAPGELRGDKFNPDDPDLPLAGPVTVLGWQYLELGYSNVKDSAAGVTVSRPAWFRVHDLLKSFDFSDLGIGG